MRSVLSLNLKNNSPELQSFWSQLRRINYVNVSHRNLHEFIDGNNADRALGLATTRVWLDAPSESTPLPPVPAQPSAA